MDAPADIVATIATLPDAVLAPDVKAHTRALLRASESVLEDWLLAHGRAPTAGRVEGFRLLALHRQAAQGDPSFNACRESCRELVYQCNMARAATDTAECARRLRLAAAVATHLGLFIAGKLENARLGEFCCSSRGLRQSPEGAAADAAMQGAE